MSKPLDDMLTVYLDGEEVPGVLLYGLGSPTNDREPSFPGEAWLGFRALKTHVFHGDAWRVQLWEVALFEIPSPSVLWRAIDVTLDAFIGSGCSVAWVAFEGSFSDPPSLFLPECMSGGVVTAKSASGRCWNRIDTMNLFEPLSDDDLLALRADAYPLASVE